MKKFQKVVILLAVCLASVMMLASCGSKPAESGANEATTAASDDSAENSTEA